MPRFYPAVAATRPVRNRSRRCLDASRGVKTVFDRNPQLCGYILDDQGAIRKHVAVFINSQMVHDRKNLDIPLQDDTEVYVMQALSGG